MELIRLKRSPLSDALTLLFLITIMGVAAARYVPYADEAKPAASTPASERGAEQSSSGPLLASWRQYLE